MTLNIIKLILRKAIFGKLLFPSFFSTKVAHVGIENFPILTNISSNLIILRIKVSWKQNIFGKQIFTNFFTSTHSVGKFCGTLSAIINYPLLIIRRGFKPNVLIINYPLVSPV